MIIAQSSAAPISLSGGCHRDSCRPGSTFQRDGGSEPQRADSVYCAVPVGTSGGRPEKSALIRREACTFGPLSGERHEEKFSLIKRNKYLQLNEKRFKGSSIEYPLFPLSHMEGRWETGEFLWQGDLLVFQALAGYNVKEDAEAVRVCRRVTIPKIRE